jgi:hypothetical protein
MECLKTKIKGYEDVRRLEIGCDTSDLDAWLEN